ncbi:MAG: phosphoribosylanthranilate isomerase [Acidobacteria bacterium]|nr:phosphoribosylanthranilate isomerase [Acidobacteriota bacterium]
MVRVKICGITNLDDARAAIDFGADALGFNFYKRSPRYIEPANAKPIIEALPPLISLVGIFADEFSPERILSIAHAIGVGTIQLHGSESPEYVKKISEVRIIKAFRVDERFDLTQLAAYRVGAYLLDAYDAKQLGGTGQTFNWDVAVQAKQHGRVILAGGLTAENVADAILQVRPYAIDVCSGAESKPGRKDLQKMEALFREVHRARSVLAASQAG